jgi:putative SOS response-associated peptidase YedK
MCGRYTLKAQPDALAEHFGLDEVPDLLPRYNVAPTQDVPAVRLAGEGPGRSWARLRWGLVPSWADDPAIGNKMINARAETVAEKPAYRDPFRKRRCLIPADGFYEWAGSGRAKTPWYFTLADGGPFAFAGLWAEWSKAAEPVRSCTMLTTEANGVVSPVHARMPVVLYPGDYARWLDPRSRPDDLRPLLEPYPDELMVGRPVGRAVNDPRHDGPDCIAPTTEA